MNEFKRGLQDGIQAVKAYVYEGYVNPDPKKTIGHHLCGMHNDKEYSRGFIAGWYQDINKKF